MDNAEARKEIRRRIVRRLNTDEWMERHFGIAAHAEDVADAVMELFPEAYRIEEGRYADGSWPQRAHEFPNYIDPTHVRYELSTAPEPLTP